jgi:hypothetical protein
METFVDANNDAPPAEHHPPPPPLDPRLQAVIENMER